MRIGFILTAGYSLMAAASAVEPLRAANHLSERKLYDIRFISTPGGWMPSSAEGGFHTTSVVEAGFDVDLVFVVSGGNPMTYNDPALRRYLRGLSRHRVKLGGISGGAAILARHGLLENRRFTVHWQHIEALRDLSADLLVERRLFVIDRDRYTCAGGVAALDMMYALIEADHGSEFARSVSDWFIHTHVRMADAPQRSDPAEQYNIQHPALASAINLMVSHLADPLTPDQISNLAGLGSRQLQRLFNEQIGEPMMQFYRRVRLAKANELLQQSASPIIDIAIATGFSNQPYFSRAFQSQYGLTPRERRKQGRINTTILELQKPRAGRSKVARGRGNVGGRGRQFR